MNIIDDLRKFKVIKFFPEKEKIYRDGSSMKRREPIEIEGKLSKDKIREILGGEYEIIEFSNPTLVLIIRMDNDRFLGVNVEACTLLMTIDIMNRPVFGPAILCFREKLDPDAWIV